MSRRWWKVIPPSYQPAFAVALVVGFVYACLIFAALLVTHA